MGPDDRLPRTLSGAPAHRDGLVVLLALAALLAWDATGLDLALVRSVAGPQGFPWREHWFTSGVLHHGGRALGLAVLAGLVLAALLPQALGLTRAERVRWLLATLAALLLVPLFKQFSLTSCPWDLAEFGGTARYVSHWRLGVADGGAGHCFPSGHATSAFAFLSGWFALRDRHPRAARAWLAAVLVLGLLFAGGQMLRGAHYASHSLWSAWLCFGVCALAWRLRRPPSRWPARARAEGFRGRHHGTPRHNYCRTEQLPFVGAILPLPAAMGGGTLQRRDFRRTQDDARHDEPRPPRAGRHGPGHHRFHRFGPGPDH